MNEHQRIGEAIGELRAFAVELRRLPAAVLPSTLAAAKADPARHTREMQGLADLCGNIAERIDEIRERMESGNR